MQRKPPDLIVDRQNYKPRQERHAIVFDGLNEFYNANKLLDVGAGFGEFVNLLQHSNLKIDATMLDLTTKCKNANVNTKSKFVLGHGGELPFKDESFDVVTVIGVLNYVNNPTKLIRETYRVSKRGGIFVTPNLNRPNRFWASLRSNDIEQFGERKQGWDYLLFEHFLSKNKWKVMDIKVRFVDSILEFPIKDLNTLVSYKLLPRLFPRLGSELFAFCKK
jgi:ubiquinone/menaquinone biosynthesis C-methylase UbiE